MKRIITIDREFGSGGREIGRCLAKKMGLAYYDHEIVDKLSEETYMSKDYIDRMDEKKPMPLFPITTAVTFGIQPIVQVDNQIDIYSKTAVIIREIAQKSDCVIVGRCGDYILRDLKPLRLFIYADIDHKIRRCKEKKYEDIKDLENKEIERKIFSVDKDRQKHYNFYTNQDWGDKKNYDFCLNTTNMEIQNLVEILHDFIDRVYKK